MAVCVVLTVGLQPHVPYSSLPAPQKAAQNSHGGWDSTAVGQPIIPCWMGSHSSLVPLQGEMRVSQCWVWQESGAG